MVPDISCQALFTHSHIHIYLRMQIIDIHVTVRVYLHVNADLFIGPDLAWGRPGVKPFVGAPNFFLKKFTQNLRKNPKNPKFSPEKKLTSKKEKGYQFPVFGLALALSPWMPHFDIIFVISNYSKLFMYKNLHIFVGGPFMWGARGHGPSDPPKFGTGQK